MLRLSFTLLALVSLAACNLDSPDDGTGRSTRDDTNGTNDSGGGGGGGGGGTTDTRQTCQQSTDCDNTVCYCVENAGDFPSPVNTQNCINGRCETPSQACPDSCSAFGQSWNGQYEIIANESSGGGGGGGSGGGGSSGDSCSEFYRNNACGQCGQEACCNEGARCDDNSECREIPSCVVACINQGAAAGYCTQECKAAFSGGSTAYEIWEDCMDDECFDLCN